MSFLEYHKNMHKQEKQIIEKNKDRIKKKDKELILTLCFEY